jgi:hypothetical protein
MREATRWGGFDFQDPPPPTYYENLPNRIGDSLTAEEYRLVRELGLLVDKDDQGVLLQVFTRPVGDRPTFFFEIIQVVDADTSLNWHRQAALMYPSPFMHLCITSLICFFLSSPFLNSKARRMSGRWWRAEARLWRLWKGNQRYLAPGVMTSSC